MDSFFQRTIRMAERECEEVSSLGRPRTVRMAWHGKTSWLIVLFVAVFFSFSVFATGRREKATTDHMWVSAGVCLLLVVIIYAKGRYDISAHDMVKRGECVVGRVTSQRQGGGKTRHSEIAYEFKDAAQRTWSGKGSDFTFEYLVDTPVLIFYDKAEPVRNVAYCCTDWRVRLEDGSLLNP
jgi:hypothetical protein